jgi:hypothetical protein
MTSIPQRATVVFDDLIETLSYSVAPSTIGLSHEQLVDPSANQIKLENGADPASGVWAMMQRPLKDA